MQTARGNFIDNRWVQPGGGATIRSVNPATDGETVLEVGSDPTAAAEAVAAAARAWPAWAALSPQERIAALRRFARELQPRVEPLARAITMEMGKTIDEARTEARSLIARIDMVAEQQLPRVSSWSAPGVDGECRYHPLGVIGVIGPYNFPLHLVHAHVIPALATGNTVVIKPSERCPFAMQRYVEAWEAAGLPPILQMIQGDGAVGRALLAEEAIRGVAFTGSWPTGHAIQKSLLERPEVLVALEMGGQNMAIVLEDADLDQAIEGLLLGGYLTTGQRCTCTQRVLIQRSIAPQLVERLIPATRSLTWGDPMSDVFMGPLATAADRDRVDALCAAGVDAGAEVLLEAERHEGGAWRGPSIHMIDADHDSDYTREEMFGPDLALTIVDDLDEAIDVVNSSAYGLSMAIFTSRRSAFEKVYLSTRVGCINWNRSTNRASGAFPFGGVGRSGNYRPAGGGAVLYTTYPVQVLWNEAGSLEGQKHVRAAMEGGDPLAQLEARHRLEEACEPYGLYPEYDASAGQVRIPLEQLGDPKLVDPLLRELEQLDVDVDRVHGALRVRIPAGGQAVLQLARDLGDALQAVRHLHPARFLSRRPRGSHVPDGSTDALSLPRSEALLDSLYAGGLVPPDKKPPVIDGFRSSGAYLASVDDDPLVFFDAASQIATLAGGMNPPRILEALFTGTFGRAPIDNPDTRADSPPSLTRLAARLRKAAPGLHHVAFCNSGSEANEVALFAASRQRPGRRAVVAFEGAFHGRTMLALHTTWNPSKRLRFELDGFQARWVPFPVADPDAIDTVPPELDPQWTETRGSSARTVPDDADGLLETELRSLIAVEKAIEDDQVAALIVEPMQAEGGDRHMTARFYVNLRALCSAYGVPFICDEVQAGFHLGGPFFWHRRFQATEPPDLVTTAKKCQVGAVISRWPLPVRSETQEASVIRGILQAQMVGEADAERYEEAARDRLFELAQRHAETVLNPRAIGYAFAFDLPTPEAMAHLVEQRLWRGYLVYGAGDRTLRFRLHGEMSVAALDALFERLDASLTSLERGEDASWRHVEQPDEAEPWPPGRVPVPEGYRIARITAREWPQVRNAIGQLQRECYEPARRDDLGRLGALIAEPGAVFLVALKGQELPPKGVVVGSAFSVPLEHVAHIEGPANDPMLGHGNTLYSADVSVHPDHQRLGLGMALKEAQVRAAMTELDGDGLPRYRFLTGRNRLGRTAAMRTINARFGAFEVSRHDGQYEGDSTALYYRIPLTAPRLPEALCVRPPRRRGVDLQGGLHRRLERLTAELEEGLAAGRLNGAIANKLSLCNFVTPGVVRAAEYLRAIAPRGLGHLIPASGRAETCDKGLRALKFHRPQGRIVLSLGPVAAGETTAAARSIGRPADDADNWFGWPMLPDPTVDPAASVEALERWLADHDPEQVLAVVVEAVYERTGRAVPEDAWEAIAAACRAADVPLVLVEHTTGGYRSGRGAWRADTLPVSVDALWWFPGGQLGLAFVNDRYDVAQKLTLISTWDGDELALTRLTWELRTARQLPIAATGERLAEVLEPLGEVLGEGLFLTVKTTRGPALQQRLAAHGVRVGLTAEGYLRVVPSLDLDDARLGHVERAVREAAKP